MASSLARRARAWACLLRSKAFDGAASSGTTGGIYGLMQGGVTRTGVVLARKPTRRNRHSRSGLVRYLLVECLSALDLRANLLVQGRRRGHHRSRRQRGTDRIGLGHEGRATRFQLVDE